MPQVYQKQAQIKALAISFMKLQYINITLPVLVEFQKMTFSSYFNAFDHHYI